MMLARRACKSIQNLILTLMKFPYQQRAVDPNSNDQGVINTLIIGYPRKVLWYFNFEYGLSCAYNLIVSVTCLLLATIILAEDKLANTRNWLFLAFLLHFINFLSKLLIFWYLLVIPTNSTFIVMNRLVSMLLMNIMYFNEKYSQIIFHFYIFGITRWIDSPLCLRNLHWANQAFMIIVGCYMLLLCNRIIAYLYCSILCYYKKEEILAMKGAALEQIDSIPCVTLTTQNATKYFDQNDNSKMCSICIQCMYLGEKVRILCCKHIFHATCIDCWLKRNSICPYCHQSAIDILKD